MTLTKKISIGLLIVASFALSNWLREGMRDEDAHIAVEQERIVTMAPSSGEVVFALELGDNVVGVSRFAKFPPEVLDKAKIGGYLDVDLEAIIRLKPSAVVLLKEQADLAEQMQQFGMDTLLVDHMSIEGILDSITKVGTRFGRQREADALKQSLTDRIEKVRKSTEANPRKKLMLSIGRDHGVGKVAGVVAAGAGGYHQQLLEIAGYENAYQGIENFPQLSRENLIRMNPDVIVDMVNSQDADSIGVEKIMADWQTHKELTAVQQGNVFLLVGDQHFVPGPRFADTLEWLASCEQGGSK